MVIILKNIPVKTQKQDIKNFVEPTVNGNWLLKRGKIHSIFILVQRNLRTRLIEYHCLVDVLPDTVAERVIKKLHRKMLVGKCVALCEYKIRDWHNDPRVNKPTPNYIKNRRIADRRDPHEDIVMEKTSMTSKQISYQKGW